MAAPHRVHCKQHSLLCLSQLLSIIHTHTHTHTHTHHMHHATSISQYYSPKLFHQMQGMAYFSLAKLFYFTWEEKLAVLDNTVFLWKVILSSTNSLPLPCSFTALHIYFWNSEHWQDICFYSMWMERRQNNIPQRKFSKYRLK